MLGKLFSPFTTAAPIGVAIRDVATGLGAIIAMLGVLGFLTEDQVQEITKQAPAVLTALGTAIYGAVTIYRILTKSSSDTAHEVAVQTDKIMAGEKTNAVVVTPGNSPNIKVGEVKP